MEFNNNRFCKMFVTYSPVLDMCYQEQYKDHWSQFDRM